MKTATLPKLIAVAVALAFVASPTPGYAQAANPPTAAITASKTGAPASQEELDRLLAPVALYPDPLLAQVLMASTYPLEVVMAARWSKENPGVTGKALEDAMQKQSWDPSVKAMTAVPTVLDRMSANVDWVHKLGDAFLGDQKAVLDSVQGLRKKAMDAGNLKTTPEQTVRTETKQDTQVIVIEPATPSTVYVPTYDPAYVYGPWYGYPPYYMYPPGYYYGTGLAFATGIFVGAAIWGNCNWGGNNVYIDHHKYNNFNRTNIGNGNGNGRWDHSVEHRKNVGYNDKRASDRFGGAGEARKSQARNDFRGRVDSRDFSGIERGSLQRTSASAGDRMGNRDFGGLDRAGGGDRMSSRDLGSGTRDFSAGSRSSSRSSGLSSGGSSIRSASVGGGSRGFGGGGGRGGGRR